MMGSMMGSADMSVSLARADALMGVPTGNLASRLIGVMGRCRPLGSTGLANGFDRAGAMADVPTSSVVAKLAGDVLRRTGPARAFRWESLKILSDSHYKFIIKPTNQVGFVARCIVNDSCPKNDV